MSILAKRQTQFRIMRVALCLGVVLALSACSNMHTLRSSINAYEVASTKVALGQGKDEVLAILLPTQATLTTRQSKSKEQYYEDEKLVEIYFFRSRSFPDGLVTDDEFTPYVFKDGVLEAIGWTAIGGPKTQAQQREQDTYIHYRGHVHF